MTEQSSGELSAIPFQAQENDEVSGDESLAPNDVTGFNNEKSRRTSSSIVASGLTVVGVSCAAAYASVKSEHAGVGITAWVAVAVIGASAMISAARHG
ncbi:MAG: hypothetical protein KDA81_02105 [Planctomycetaceae bacterium]|nr:hypothetical protein [Planctomycetaceae bacterium]